MEKRKEGIQVSNEPVRVLFFSVLRDRVGAGEHLVALSEPVTGADLLDTLEGRFPLLRPYRSVVRLAVNRAYVPAGELVHPGDEVALITPVSGG